MRTVQNWAGNHSYAGELVSPTSLEAAAEAVAGATRVRPLGSRHSFNAIADSAGLLISLERLAYRHPSLAHDAPSGPEPVLDEHTGHVRVPAATRYADLARFLEERGRTLPNFASLPHISIAGSLATATHGSGVDQQVLASAVVEIGLVLADGTRRTFSRDVDGDLLNGVVVSLGALGLVHEVTLATVPAFEVSQTVYGPIPLAAVADEFDAVSALGYSVSCFTALREETVDSLWVKQPAAADPAPDSVLGVPALTEKVHPIGGIDPANATEQLRAAGPASERLPHFRADHLPSAGAEIQCEYLVPRHSVRLALRALTELATPLAGLVQVCEIRSVAADDFWLSPMYQQPCVGIHFTLVRDIPRVAQVLPVIDAALGVLGGRPHWGKQFHADPERVRALYPRRADFLDLARTLDPGGVFTNDFVTTWVG